MKNDDFQFNFYKKTNKSNSKTTFYIRMGIYAIALIFIIASIVKLNRSNKPKKFEDLRNKTKVKAEIYGNGSIYNNYYYGVRITRPSADWDIVKIEDKYEDKIPDAKTLENRIKPLAFFVVKDGEKEVASVFLNIVIFDQPRTSVSLAEESFTNLLKNYGNDNVKILQKPTIHTKGSLKASYYVAEITKNDLTFIEVFVVKNRRIFNLHGQTSPERYDVYLWDFEHYINNMVIYW
ncbi:hypothetical protein HY745_14695 [Candidatus Desantisbacteria bacterium]|nr:hypothetical protein [Candidatus Desantisbacteria bacterium]